MLYGIIDLAVGQLETQAPGPPNAAIMRERGVINGALQTSCIGFRGSEDLGGGYSTRFQIESFRRADTGQNGRNGRYDTSPTGGADNVWSCDTFVGLAGGFGEIRLRANATPLWIAMLQTNSLAANSLFSPSFRQLFNGGARGRIEVDTAMPNSVRYQSPVVLGDIPHHVLETAYQQYLRLARQQAANDHISNALAELPIFPHYSFDLETLYGSVDGYKFSVARPTAKARHSRKYFGRGKGVVAYTLLYKHAPLQGWMIGAHEYEAHHVFDIGYRKTSEIVPTAITGDMHGVNTLNFAFLHSFGPRFKDLDKQLGEIYCAGDPARYAHCLIQPAGQIDLQIITDEKENIDRIVATLGLKEMTQSTLVRKLCTYDADPTRRAIFELDRLVLWTRSSRGLTLD